MDQQGRLAVGSADEMQDKVEGESVYDIHSRAN